MRNDLRTHCDNSPWISPAHVLTHKLSATAAEQLSASLEQDSTRDTTHCSPHCNTNLGHELAVSLGPRTSHQQLDSSNCLSGRLFRQTKRLRDDYRHLCLCNPRLTGSNGVYTLPALGYQSADGQPFFCSQGCAIDLVPCMCQQTGQRAYVQQNCETITQVLPVLHNAHKQLPFCKVQSCYCNLHGIHPELSQLKLEPQVKKQRSLVLGTTSSQPAESHISTVNECYYTVQLSKLLCTLFRKTLSMLHLQH